MRKRLLFTGLLSVVSIGLTLTAGEFFLRQRLKDTLVGYVEYTRRSITLREAKPNQSTVIRPDPRLLAASDGLEVKSVNFRIDPDGFIQPSARHVAPDLTIGFMGGSTTECIYVDELKRFPHGVAIQLEEQYGIKVNSFNGGGSGNNSLHSINKIVNILAPKRPDLIFFMHNINDLVTLTFLGTYWSDAERGNLTYTDVNLSLGYFKYLVKRSAQFRVPGYYTLAKRVKDRVITLRDDEFSRHQKNFDANIAREEALLQAFKTNLKLFVSVSRALGSTPVLMTQANRIENDDPFVRSQYQALRPGQDYDQWAKLYAKFNETIRTVSKEEAVPLVDLARRVPPSREYLFDAVHFNDNGSELAASVIVEALATILPFSKLAHSSEPVTEAS